MKRTPAAATLFVALLMGAGTAGSAQPILASFTGLPGAVADCKWFDDNLNTDRDVGSLTRQTDLLYNRIALPAGENVALGATATSAEGDELIDYKLGSKTVCSTAVAIYGSAAESTETPKPLPTN
jgi:hypothetical protein